MKKASITLIISGILLILIGILLPSIIPLFSASNNTIGIIGGADGNNAQNITESLLSNLYLPYTIILSGSGIVAIIISFSLLVTLHLKRNRKTL